MRNLVAASVPLLLMLLVLPCSAQDTGNDKEAELDEEGDIFVSSDTGRLIWMADTRHCSESIFATDRQTVGCMLAPSSDVFPTAPSLKLEIYLEGGKSDDWQPPSTICGTRRLQVESAQVMLWCDLEMPVQSRTCSRP